MRYIERRLFFNISEAAYARLVMIRYAAPGLQDVLKIFLGKNFTEISKNIFRILIALVQYDRSAELRYNILENIFQSLENWIKRKSRIKSMLS